MNYIDFILWFFVFVCVAALFYLEYLRLKLRNDDMRREMEREHRKLDEFLKQQGTNK